jgi:hypothetical protein
LLAPGLLAALGIVGGHPLLLLNHFQMLGPYITINPMRPEHIIIDIIPGNRVALAQLKRQVRGLNHQGVSSFERLFLEQNQELRAKKLLIVRG